MLFTVTSTNGFCKSGLKLVCNVNIIIEAINGTCDQAQVNLGLLRSIALSNNQPLAGGNIGIRKLVDCFANCKQC